MPGTVITYLHDHIESPQDLVRYPSYPSYG